MGKHERVVHTECDVRQIFLQCDQDHDGLLNRKELKCAYGHLGKKLPWLNARLALHHADADRDGHINSKELDVLVKNARSH
uniref:Calmodulin-like protein 5 n=1 Tax=Rhizophora mucronata TaxID=61149 RepID=A0A2P2J764_RHIMU